MICRGFSTIQTVVVVWDFWTINSMVLEKRFYILPLSMQFALLCRSLHPPTVHPHDHWLRRKLVGGWINQPESEKYKHVRRQIGNHHFPKVRGEHVNKNVWNHPNLEKNRRNGFILTKKHVKKTRCWITTNRAYQARTEWIFSPQFPPPKKNPSLTLPETNSKFVTENRPKRPKRKLILQPSIFRCYCWWLKSCTSW